MTDPPILDGHKLLLWESIARAVFLRLHSGRVGFANAGSMEQIAVTACDYADAFIAQRAKRLETKEKDDE